MVAMDGLAVPLTLTALASFFGLFFVRLYQKQGFVSPSSVLYLAKKLIDIFYQPMPPHSFLFGHLKFVASVVGKLSPHVHGVYIADQIRQKYPEMDTAFYLDI